MATTVTITPSTTSISATAQTTTLTISSAIASSVGTTASNVTLGSPVGTLTSQSTVEGALNFLANQFYVATSAPSADTTNLAEGDLFYDTDDNQLKIYRETSSGNFEFVPIMIGNSSADSDTVDAGGF